MVVAGGDYVHLLRKAAARSAEMTASQSAKSSEHLCHRMRRLFPKLRLCPILKHHALVFVRLAHDRRFVGAVLLFLFFVLFVLVLVSSSSSSGSRGGIVSPIITKGLQSINLVEKLLGGVWGHVVAPRVWTLGDFTPSAPVSA